MTILQDSKESDTGFILDTNNEDLLASTTMRRLDANFPTDEELEAVLGAGSEQPSTEEPVQQQEQPPQPVDKQQPPPVVTPDVLQPDVDPISLNRKDFKAKYGSKKGSGKTPFIWVDMDKWRFMPRGPERDEAEKAWRMKYFGTTEKGSGFIYGSGKPGASLTDDLASWSQNTLEGLSSVGAGRIDWFLSELPSLITEPMGLGRVPRIIPEFDNPLHKTVRNISGPLGAYLGLRKFALSKLAASGFITPTTGVAKRLATEAIITKPIGAFVDYTSSLSREGHNLTGFLKDEVLGDMGTWIPEWLATNDSDSPDQKKWKTVLEGVTLDFLADLTVGTAMLAKAGFSTR